MAKKPRGSIHKIQEFELEKINLMDEFDILQIVGEGWFGKILLVEHRASHTEIVLKAVPKPYVSLRDFYREFHYGLHLGVHRNIVTTYDLAFETAGFYVFTQEFAPMGDLTSNVTDTGVGEVYSKRVAKQVASAIDFMHSKDIVHRDVKLDNVLIFRSDFSRVKLCDFGESYQVDTMVERRNEWLPYSPPEVLEIKPEGTYKADPSHDVWQFGIVMFVCLTGCLPWQKAASDDPRYMRYINWQGSMMMMPIRRTPKLFKLLTSRAQRMFRRFLEPRADRRPKNLTDLTKFLDDRWLAKTAEKDMAEYETDELCPSMYSFHSSPDEKHRLLYTLADCGIETNVDRQTKKNRIKDWIESSVITEEDEDAAEEANSASASSSVSREPVPGHISSIRASVEKPKEIKTNLKDASQKHFDPRTGALQKGPSEMGTTQLSARGKSESPSVTTGSYQTLSSRQDLLGSNAHMFNSDADLNRLGELDDFEDDGFINQSLSSGNLLMSPDDELPPYYGSRAASVGLAPIAGSPTPKSILLRSKSDSVKTAMYASSPAVNSTAYGQNFANTAAATNNKYSSSNAYGSGSGYAPNGSSYFVNSAAAAPNGNGGDFKSDARITGKSVTFTGLTNAFQSLAQISMPPGAASAQQPPPPYKQQQPQPPPSHSFNRPLNDSQVKDSGYEFIENNQRSSAAAQPASRDRHPHVVKHQQKVPVVPHQSDRSPLSMATVSSTTMKDTAYDRVVLTNNNAKKRR